MSVYTFVWGGGGSTIMNGLYQYHGFCVITPNKEHKFIRVV